MSNLIEEFVQGNLKVAKKRLYLSPELGGLGLFELGTYLTAQRVSWIGRSLNLDELWKIRLFLAGHGNNLNVRKCEININSNPVLYSIVESYEIFLGGFTRWNENFWESNIYENPALFLRLRDKAILKSDFFDAGYFAANKSKILNLTVDDFFNNRATY